MLGFDASDFPTLLPSLKVEFYALLIFLILYFGLGRFVPDLLSRLERLLAGIARRPILGFLILVFSVLVVRLCLLPVFPVPTPGIHDEHGLLLAADTFAHGRLTNPTHPMWMSLETFHVNFLPTYCSKYPPAQGMVLAVGQLLGLPWIGVLLSSALMCGVIFWMLRGWIPARWALLGAALVLLRLAIASYWINSYWGGPVSAIGGALVLGALPRIFKKRRTADALLLGLGVAILANSRPYEGFFFCLPTALVLLLWIFRQWKTNSSTAPVSKSVVLPLAAVIALNLAFMGYYNWRTTHNALLFPYAVNDRTYGSAANFIWQTPGPEKNYNNSRFDEFYNDWERSYYGRSLEDFIVVSNMKNARLFANYGWWGSLLLFPGLFYALRDRKLQILWITIAFTLLAVFLVVWANAHYAAPATALLFALVVQSLRHVRTMKLGKFRWGLALGRLAVFLLLVNTVNLVIHKKCDPLWWTCAGERGREMVIEKFRAIPGKHLVVVRYEGSDISIHDEWVYNSADIDNSKIVWARETNPDQDRELFRYFKDRSAWLLTFEGTRISVQPYTRPEK